MSSLASPSERADAAHNRRLLLEAASQAFAASSSPPSMRAIARQAGLGVGTLYRHFPTREALVEAVYHHQVAQLIQDAANLLGQLPPSEALRRWMDLFFDWLLTKHGMSQTLMVMIENGELSQAHTRVALLAAIDTMLQAGHDSGSLRKDITSDDLATALLGIFTVTSHPARRETACRLLDLLLDGLKAV